MRNVMIVIVVLHAIGSMAANLKAAEDAFSEKGREPGERRELVPDMSFRWCPGGPLVKTDSETQALTEIGSTNGFWVAETELTEKQWVALMGTRPWEIDRRFRSKSGDNYPAVDITFDEAVEFCVVLTAAERMACRLPKKWKYTLPTVEQWEYVCRAHTRTMYHFGNNEARLGEYCWFRDNTHSVGEHYAHAVGQKKPNPWGLMDMNGNVSEWCTGASYAVMVISPSDDLPTGQMRPIMGGHFIDHADHCCSSSVALSPSCTRSPHIGLRIIALPE